MPMKGILRQVRALAQSTFDLKGTGKDEKQIPHQLAARLNQAGRPR
jgi:hypothetical protein